MTLTEALLELNNRNDTIIHLKFKNRQLNQELIKTNKVASTGFRKVENLIKELENIKKEIRQIAYESGLWAINIERINQMKIKVHQKPSDNVFKEKFDRWIENRIQMILDK